MNIGPIELIVLGFPGNEFNGEVAPALRELIDTGLINIIDLLFVVKDEDGNVAIVELEELDDENYEIFVAIVPEHTGLLGADDAEQFGAALEPNSSALLIAFENAWASRFATAVAESKGVVIFNERIPRAIIEEVLAEGDEADEE